MNGIRLYLAASILQTTGQHHTKDEQNPRYDNRFSYHHHYYPAGQVKNAVNSGLARTVYRSQEIFQAIPHRAASSWICPVSRNCFKAMALLYRSSWAENTNVTFPSLFIISLNCWTTQGLSWSSIKYLWRNVSHFPGSWPNHLRRDGLAPASLNQRSIWAFSFDIPLGQSLSTSTRYPSSAAGWSYMRFTMITKEMHPFRYGKTPGIS